MGDDSKGWKFCPAFGHKHSLLTKLLPLSTGIKSYEIYKCCSCFISENNYAWSGIKLGFQGIQWSEGSLIWKVDSPKCPWLKNILKIRQKGTCELDLAEYMFQILWVKVLSFKSYMYVWIFPKIFNIQLPYIAWSSPIEF